MVYGMTYDEFWFGDPYRVVAYRKRHKLQVEQRNEELWLAGLYIHNAVSVAINNNFSKSKQKYINKPLQLFPPDENERRVQIEENNRKLVERLNRFKDEFEKRQRG